MLNDSVAITQIKVLERPTHKCWSTYGCFLIYRVFDNEVQKVWAYCSDQKVAKDRWQNFTESGSFWQIHAKQRKRIIEVLMALSENFPKLRKFVKIH